MKQRLTPQEKAAFTPQARALFRIESDGGHWDAVGPLVQGDRAYGVSQVMGNNIPTWTQRYYGQSLTPNEYLRNKAAQIAVTNGVIAEYWDKYSSAPDEYTRMRMVAAAWFGGEGAVHLYDSPTYSDGYTTMREYTTVTADEYVRLAGTQSPPPPSDVLPVPGGNPPVGNSTGEPGVHPGLPAPPPAGQLPPKLPTPPPNSPTPPKAPPLTGRRPNQASPFEGTGYYPKTTKLRRAQFRKRNKRNA